MTELEVPEFLLKQGYHLEPVPEQKDRAGFHVIEGEVHRRLAWFTGREWYVPPGDEPADRMGRTG